MTPLFNAMDNSNLIFDDISMRYNEPVVFETKEEVNGNLRFTCNHLAGVSLKELTGKQSVSIKFIPSSCRMKLSVNTGNLWKKIKNALTYTKNPKKMTVLKKLQKQLSMIRNLRCDAPMQGNITNIISNVLFFGILLSFVISTTWYFSFINREENYLKYTES